MKESIIKINKTKSWFFDKIKKIDKTFTRLIKKKREKNKINKIRNEKGEVTTDNAETQRNIRNYYEQLYVNKIDTLEPDPPVAPQDEAGLTKTFQTWPRGWFHIP